VKLPHRRQFLHMAAGTAALPAVSRIARAQAYPTRPVRIIVAYAAGGPNDLFARLIGQWLSERLGQQFVVEHRAGAGGTIGTEAVVKAPPDGYTLLCTIRDWTSHATYAALDLSMSNVVHPATVHRQHLCRNPT
jgi:tripartite-type tricarboxylate transporter receptor subunit TctC